MQGPFVLSMAPGFFGFYAHTGALMALEDADLLDGVRHTRTLQEKQTIVEIFLFGWYSFVILRASIPVMRGSLPICSIISHS